MEKTEKKSFLSRLLNRKKINGEGKRLYSNTKKTTTKIKLALLDLLNTKELSQINITHLVKVAGVYRATFYLHYKNLNEVVDDIEHDVIDCYDMLKDCVKDIDLYNNIDVLINKINEYITIDKKYLQIIINTNCFNGITIKLRQLIYDILVDNFYKFGYLDQNSNTLFQISSFTGGLVFIYRDWINDLEVDIDKLNSYIKLFYENIFKISSN